jgi:hypothetical protein
MKRNYDGLPKIRSALAGFQERERQIRRNPDLTQAGSQRALTALRNEAENFRAEARNELDLEWRLTRAEYKIWQQAVAKAESEAGAAWDFSHLLSEREAARSQLKTIVENATGDDFGAARRLYNAAVNSGDKHKARAWLDVAPEIMLNRFGNNADLQIKMDVNQLVKDAGEQLETILDTPELAALRVEEVEITNRAIEAMKVTEETDAFYNPSNVGALVIPDEFNNLVAGVTITLERKPGDLTKWRKKLEISDVPEREIPTETDQQRMERLGLN